MERIRLRVLAETNLSFFLVFTTFYTNPTAISNNPRNVYWFPSTFVKPGDQVVLYSGFGQNRSVRTPDGITNHFFYWGQKEYAVETAYGDCAVLFEVESWQTTPLE